MSQRQLAEKAGVGVRFIRELEYGKQSVRLDKVNQVLAVFGSCFFWFALCRMEL